MNEEKLKSPIEKMMKKSFAEMTNDELKTIRKRLTFSVVLVVFIPYMLWIASEDSLFLPYVTIGMIGSVLAGLGVYFILWPLLIKARGINE